MDLNAKILITVGALLIVGLIMDILGERTKLPRVTLLILFGFAIGPHTLNLLPHVIVSWFPIITNMALAMVGFLLGGKLTLLSLKNYGHYVLYISLSAVIITALTIFIGLTILGTSLAVILILAAIASATDPAATSDVIHQLKAKGPFTSTLLNIVAIDDAWALMLFSLLLIAVHVVYGSQAGIHHILLRATWEIFGALLSGIILGVPMAYITGRIKPGEPTLVETLGLVFIATGVAIWLHVSFLLCAMTLGFIVTNFAKHHTRPFHAIENIEWPFMILFFILAGASLHFGSLAKVGLIGIFYIILRFLGRILGAWLGGKISKAPTSICNYMGFALMPQAGVALGLALLASQTFPQLSEIILPLALGGTIFFEILGPILTRFALIKAKEATR